MIGAMGQMYLNALGLIAILISVLVLLFIADRKMSRRADSKRRVHAYICTVTGCDRPAEPWDGPFCPDHTWNDV